MNKTRGAGDSPAFSVKELKRMTKPYELEYTELKKGCFPDELGFQTTA